MARQPSRTFWLLSTGIAPVAIGLAVLAAGSPREGRNLRQRRPLRIQRPPLGDEHRERDRPL